MSGSGRHCPAATIDNYNGITITIQHEITNIYNDYKPHTETQSQLVDRLTVLHLIFINCLILNTMNIYKITKDIYYKNNHIDTINQCIGKLSVDDVNNIKYQIESYNIMFVDKCKINDAEIKFNINLVNDKYKEYAMRNNFDNITNANEVAKWLHNNH